MIARVLVAVVLASTTLAAQADPIRCWWQTSTGAVAVGEPFTATLTCAAREQDTVRTVPDETRLAAAVVPLSPFEVLGGSHPADLQSPSHRFLQYHYTLRIIDRDVIGHDTAFPDLHIPYRVHTLVNGEWSAGRDRTYTIPSHTIRVLSLVPADARDIRDSDPAGLERVAALRTRARGFELAAYALVVLALLIATPAVAGLVRRRQATAKTPNVPSRRDVLGAVDAELAAVLGDKAHGWSSTLVARAMHALRLAAAVALGRQPASHLVEGEPRADRLVVAAGRVRRRRFEVSSAVTPVDIRRAIAALPATAPAAERDALETLATSLAVLSGILYRDPFLADGTLDEAVESGRRAARQVWR